MKNKILITFSYFVSLFGVVSILLFAGNFNFVFSATENFNSNLRIDTENIIIDKGGSVALNNNGVDLSGRMVPEVRDILDTPNQTSQTEFKGLITCDGSKENPCNFNALINIINKAIDWFIGISASVAAVTFAYAGAKILLNPSNPKKLDEGKEMFRKTVYGLLIVLCAWLVVYTVINTLVPASFGALRFLQ